MGKYINIGNEGFRKARNDEYIDKSELIGFVKPLLSDGYIAMTQPDKPTNSKQQYYQTELGTQLMIQLK